MPPPDQDPNGLARIGSARHCSSKESLPTASWWTRSMRMSEPSTANFWTSSSKLVYATAFLLQVLLMRQRTCQRTMCAGSAEKNLDPSRHGAVTLSRYMAGPMRADTYKKDLLASLVADCIPRMNVWSAISGLMPLVVRLWRHSVDFFRGSTILWKQRCPGPHPDGLYEDLVTDYGPCCSSW